MILYENKLPVLPGSMAQSLGQGGRAREGEGGLVTAQNAPAVHSSRWEELSQQAQNALLTLEKQVLSHRRAEEDLANSELLRTAHSRQESLQSETASLAQALSTLADTFDADIDRLSSFRQHVLTCMRDTEDVTSQYHRSLSLHPRLLSQSSSTSRSSGTTPATASNSAVDPSLLLQQSQPHPFFQRAVDQLETNARNLEQPVSELESVYGDNQVQPSSNGTTLQSIETAIAGLHDYLVHVAAQVEQVHERAEALRSNQQQTLPLTHSL